MKGNAAVAARKSRKATVPGKGTQTNTPRERVAAAKRIVVKVGTNVVMRDDGSASIGVLYGIAESLASLAGLNAAAGNPQQAARLLGAAEATLESIGGAWWPADRGEINHTRSRLQNELGENAYQAEWTNGRTMTLDQVLAGAQNVSQ